MIVKINVVFKCAKLCQKSVYNSVTGYCSCLGSLDTVTLNSLDRFFHGQCNYLASINYYGWHQNK
jgi:hypothetical protein